MTFDIALVLSIVALAVLLFVTERIRVDLVALLVLGSLALTGLVTPTEALSGFSNPAVVDDPVHDSDHILRVLALAERIGQAEGANLDILHTALLHDVGWGEVKARGQDHAQFAAARTRQILSHVPPDKVEAVVVAILAHRVRAGLPPECPEGCVLFDADKPNAFIVRLFDRRANEVTGQC